MHAVTRFGTRRVDLTTGVGPSPGLLVLIHRQRRDVGKVLNELKNKRVEKRARGGQCRSEVARESGTLDQSDQVVGAERSDSSHSMGLVSLCQWKAGDFRRSTLTPVLPAGRPAGAAFPGCRGSGFGCSSHPFREVGVVEIPGKFCPGPGGADATGGRVGNNVSPIARVRGGWGIPAGGPPRTRGRARTGR